MVDEVALVVGQQVRRGIVNRKARHDVADVEIDDLGGAAERLAGAAVPDRQQDLAVRGDEHAQLGVLAVPGLATLADVGFGDARRQGQHADGGALDQPAEFGQRLGQVEVPFVFLEGERQRHEQRYAVGDGRAGGDAVAALGQRVEHEQRQAREIQLQCAQELRHPGLEHPGLGGRDVAMPGHADDERQKGIANLRHRRHASGECHSPPNRGAP